MLHLYFDDVFSVPSSDGNSDGYTGVSVVPP